jgi:hypothetical protein
MFVALADYLRADFEEIAAFNRAEQEEKEFEKSFDSWFCSTFHIQSVALEIEVRNGN